MSLVITGYLCVIIIIKIVSNKTFLTGYLSIRGLAINGIKNAGKATKPMINADCCSVTERRDIIEKK